MRAPGPEVLLHPLVRDDRNAALDVRDDDLLPDEIPIAVVLGVHGHGDVADDRRGPCGRDRHVPLPVRERIADVRECVVDVSVHELEVGERGHVERAPVDDPVVAVDPTLRVEVDEEVHDGAHVALVHREALAPVVEGGTHAAKLAHDRPPVEVEPLPDPGLERLPSEVVARLPFPGEILLDGVLGRDAGMVVARLEEDIFPLHSLPANQRVREGQLECMPHVELAGDVRRRVGDDEALTRRVWLGRVEALLFPGPLPALLDAFGSVQGFHVPIVRA